MSGRRSLLQMGSFGALIVCLLLVAFAVPLDQPVAHVFIVAAVLAAGAFGASVFL